jgi:hypothetical protein
MEIRIRYHAGGGAKYNDPSYTFNNPWTIWTTRSNYLILGGFRGP